MSYADSLNAHCSSDHRQFNCVDCFCNEHLYEIGFEVPFAWCNEFMTNASLLRLLIYGSAGVVVLINAVLKIVLVQLAKFERKKSVTALRGSMMTKIAVAQFINTAVVLVLINTYLDIGGTVLNDGYEDFSLEWYAIVGTTLLTTMAINTFSSHLISVVFYFFGALHRKCKECCGCCLEIHQDELNEIFTLPEFRVADRYACFLFNKFDNFTGSYCFQI